MSLSPGTRLGAYEILSPLGAGGMGEVYKARDTKLGRDVAIKILPELFVADPERVARFEREAQLLAALNHPNIAAIYGLDESGPTKYLVLELVDGESLDARLKARAPSDGALGFSRAIAVDDALAIARQIVDALEAAHDKGIIHRDLKPANIMLTPDGQVKVLDFGLAKLEAGGAGEAGGDFTHSPTLTYAATQAGMILGTAAYMSPEQAKGRAADKRSDVWAFGCVLYEMLTSRRAFDGEDATEVIAAVVRAEPDWTAFPRTVPAHVRDVVTRCLVKDRKARLPDISVARFLLDAPARSATTTASATGKRFGATAGVAIGAAAVGALATWLAVRTAPSQPAQPARFTVATPAANPLSVAGTFRSVVISPTGRHIVYATGLTGSRQLAIRPIDQLDAQIIRGTTDTVDPFFSPDGRWIGFFERNGELKKVSVTGGPPVTLCKIEGAPRGASWGDDDTIVFATNDFGAGLMSVPARGGEPRVLTKPDAKQGEEDHLFPSWLPGARAVVFTITPSGPVENAQIAVLDLKTGTRKTLVHGGTRAEYVNGSSNDARGGYLVYAAAGSLRAVRFDPARLEVSSDPVPVIDQVMTKPNGTADFTLSRHGDIVYVPGGATTSMQRTLLWVDRQGREEPMATPPRAYAAPRISPDGTRVALEIRDQQNDIWVLDLAHLTLTRLTIDPAIEGSPVWTPDSRRIIFSSNRGGAGNLYWQPADNTGGAERLTTSPNTQVPSSVTPDGRQVAFHEGRAGLDILVLPLPAAPASDKPQAKAVVQTSANEAWAEISPDGRWIAYESNQSGSGVDVFVRPFPDVNAGLSQISMAGGRRPAWSRDSHELFFVDAANLLESVQVQPSSGPAFRFTNPAKVLSTPYFTTAGNRTYDVSPDGKRFLVIKEPTGATEASTGMVVVLNFLQELDARVPQRN